MNTFAELRLSLEKLPDLQKAKKYGANYAQFLKIAIAAKDKLSATAVALPLANSVVSALEFKEVTKKIALASKGAKLIAKKLEHPDSIGDTSTEKSFMALKEIAEVSLIACTKCWESQIVGKAKQWKDIAGFLSTLGGVVGGEKIKPQAAKLSNVIRSLESAASDLPKNEGQVLAVKNNLQSLVDAVRDLDLETPFGKFLRAASDGGADLESIENPGVSEAIKKHNLQKSFRIRIA
jgi:hypothetical protein